MHYQHAQLCGLFTFFLAVTCLRLFCSSQTLPNCCLMKCVLFELSVTGDLRMDDAGVRNSLQTEDLWVFGWGWCWRRRATDCSPRSCWWQQPSGTCCPPTSETQCPIRGEEITWLTTRLQYCPFHMFSLYWDASSVLPCSWQQPDVTGRPHRGLKLCAPSPAAFACRWIKSMGKMKLYISNAVTWGKC